MSTGLGQAKSCDINSEIFLSDMVLELNLIAVKGVQQESLVDLL
jgi:hypothetical protein